MISISKERGPKSRFLRKDEHTDDILAESIYKRIVDGKGQVLDKY